jgi:creatinine amidohydrolase/Fe(II)-dependent formamide hydrolase-like protein
MMPKKTKEELSNSPPLEPLKQLLVIDRLEVGPIRLEAKRLTAPYTVIQHGKRETFKLIYSYQERVFDPIDPDHQNLAAMLAAQVGLNYGLFCREIVFHGFYDSLDRRFLRTMAENTAKEIYVKKFLEPNPFIKGPIGQLPVVKQSSYCQARLRFVDSRKNRRKLDRWNMWSTKRSHYCILSSGGKDSLLSFGLIQEILGTKGQGDGEVHPIFVNESGRHWFTALNAYRYFEKHVSHSARVWVNSDRLFVWMLRHLPFIRPDFASQRSDEYPIRLWTVAVFLFGVLPLMRKHGLGRLLIGDEFDTSIRASHKGIHHYDGLFDQSIYFDQTVSSYFLQKGWAISQFSILRPLSELLIEAILAKRYPHLQTLQMSCHATRKSKAGQVLPCGRCEKCRRIVGMLTAVEIDPKLCGYGTQQIQTCLQRLVTHGIHQEVEGVQHLLYLLIQKNAIKPLPKGLRAEEHPEVVHLRFDSDHSPITAIPLDLRAPLYRILSEHTQGALLKVGMKWRELDLFSHPAFSEPYTYEVGASRTKESLDSKTSETLSEKHLWGSKTWPLMQAYLKRIDLALLPVGAIEQHGPHLPLDTDAFDAEYLARRVAEACNDPKPLVMPLVPYGVSYHHSDFCGTLSIRNESLSGLIYDIGMSAAKNGIRKLVIINAHGGNGPALNYAAQMINRDAHIFVCVDSGETSDVDIDPLTQTKNDVHAGEIETSTSLAVRPHLVRRDEAVSEVPRFSSRYLDFTSKRGVLWYGYTDRISESGIMGNPLVANRQKGEKIWKIMIAHLVALVEDLKQMTLEEIHHRSL